MNIPFKDIIKRLKWALLIFSRKQLQQWTSDRTVTKEDPTAIAAAHLAETVQKRQARKR